MQPMQHVISNYDVVNNFPYLFNWYVSMCVNIAYRYVICHEIVAINHIAYTNYHYTNSVKDRKQCNSGSMPPTLLSVLYL